MTRGRSRQVDSPLDLAIAILELKWTVLIVQQLRSGPCRFRELQERLPEVSHKVLIQQLRVLERECVISRRVGVGGPRRVIYGLTESGLALLPILDALEEWGRAHTAFAEELAAQRAQRAGRRPPRRRT